MTVTQTLNRSRKYRASDIGSSPHRRGYGSELIIPLQCDCHFESGNAAAKCMSACVRHIATRDCHTERVTGEINDPRDSLFVGDFEEIGKISAALIEIVANCAVELF